MPFNIEGAFWYDGNDYSLPIVEGKVTREHFIDNPNPWFFVCEMKGDLDGHEEDVLWFSRWTGQDEYEDKIEPRIVSLGKYCLVYFSMFGESPYQDKYVTNGDLFVTGEIEDPVTGKLETHTCIIRIFSDINIIKSPDIISICSNGATLDVSLESYESEDISEGTYEWELLPVTDSEIEWLTPQDELVVAYRPLDNKDRLFKFWYNKGTGAEQFVLIWHYGTPVARLENGLSTTSSGVNNLVPDSVIDSSNYYLSKGPMGSSENIYFSFKKEFSLFNSIEVRPTIEYHSILVSIHLKLEFSIKLEYINLFGVRVRVDVYPTIIKGINLSLISTSSIYLYPSPVYKVLGTYESSCDPAPYTLNWHLLDSPYEIVNFYIEEWIKTEWVIVGIKKFPSFYPCHERSLYRVRSVYKIVHRSISRLVDVYSEVIRVVGNTTSADGGGSTNFLGVGPLDSKVDVSLYTSSTFEGKTLNIKSKKTEESDSSVESVFISHSDYLYYYPRIKSLLPEKDLEDIFNNFTHGSTNGLDHISVNVLQLIFIGDTIELD